MGWFDDAKEKVDEAKQTAKEEAAKKTAEAALSMATSAVSRTVTGALESLVSSAEESLSNAEESARRRGINLDGPDLTTDTSELEQTIRTPEEDELGRAMRAALDDAPRTPPVEDEPTPEEAPDIFADAQRVLARAREARGLEPAPPASSPRPRGEDPVAAALAAAAEARAIASSGGRRAMAREESARAQLEAMKRHAGLPFSSPDGSDDDDPTPQSPTPKKRTL